MSAISLCARQNKNTEFFENSFVSCAEILNIISSPVASHEIICDESGAPVDYRFVEVNPAFEELLGKKSSEIVGKTVLELMPETEPSWIEKYGEVALTGQQLKFQDYSSELGKYFDVLAFSPKKGFFTVVANDVSSLVLALENQSKKQEKFRRLIETTKTIPWEFDLLKGEFTFIGKQIETILGFPASKWKTFDDWANCIHPDERESAAAFCIQKTREKKDHIFEYRVIDANGQVRWLLDDVNVQLENYEPVRLSGFIVDITESRLAEQKLREKERTLNKIINATFEGLYVVNKEGECIYINKSAQKLLNYSEGDFLGFNTHELISHTSGDGSQVSQRDCLLTKVLQAGKSIYQDDGILWKSDGDYINVEYRVEPVFDENAILGAVVTFNDISERKKMYERQILSNQMETLGELAAGVAHEINNPISGVINYAEMLLDKNIKVKDPDLLLRNIIKEGERVASIVRNLLTFSTKDREKKGPVSLIKVISNSIELMQKLLTKDDIIIDTHLDENLPKVYGNEQKLEQVLLNLLSNARYALNKKYQSTDPNKILRIASVYDEGVDRNGVKLILWDKGCGISKEHLGKVFNKFFTTKPSGQGTGLGLPIVYDILNDCNATIDIESEEETYTKVSIRFTVYDA